MNVNTQVWGEEFWEIGTNTINCRNNVADKTDVDYENFPPFISNKVPDVAAADYPCSLFQFVENELMELNAEIDKSICYVGFEGGALSDISAWHTDEWHTGDPWLYTDPTDNKTTYMLVDSYMDKSIATPSMATTTGAVWPSTYSTAQLGLYNRYVNWSPDAITGGDLTTTANQKLINRNLRLSPYRSWGLRSIYLVINVAYLTNTPTDGGSTNPTFSKTTLHSYYADHNDTWRNTHPILGAWAVPYSRISKAGGYSNTQSSGSTYNRGNHTTSVSIISELHDGDGIRYDYRFATNYNVTMGYFPLFGYVGLGHPDVTSIPVSSDTLACPLYMGMRTAPNITKKASTNGVCWAEMDGNAEGSYDYLMSCCAYYGLYFADGTYSLSSSGQDETRWTDPNICLPIISEQGYTDGSYTRGAYNVTNPAFEWKDTTRSPYNPSRPPTPTNEYDTTTTFATIGDLATLTKQYILSGTFVKLLGEQLYNCIVDLTDNDTDVTELSNKIKSEFLVNDPIDCIVSLRRFPTQPPIKQQGDDNLVHLLLGRYDTLLSVYELAHPTGTYTFTLSTPIYPVFGDSFADYEPYVSMELYIPFCGTVQLHPQDILGRKLSVKLIMDYTTGTATAFVLSGDLAIETITGTLGVDIPVSGIQGYTTASQLQNAIINRKSAVASEIQQGFNIINNVTNPVGYFTGLYQSNLQRQQADYDLQHVNAPMHIVGASSPITSWAIDPTKCRLLIYYPTGDVIDDSAQQPKFIADKLSAFGATQGFATIETSTIGSYSGLVIAANPLLGSMSTANSKALTDEEIQLVKSVLAEGVIV